jgi:hypothetical protein
MEQTLYWQTVLSKIRNLPARPNRVICLTAKAKAEIDKLLALEPGKTLASLSTWADERRNPSTMKLPATVPMATASCLQRTNFCHTLASHGC